VAERKQKKVKMSTQQVMLFYADERKYEESFRKKVDANAC
jgi:hypothetical protein